MMAAARVALLVLGLLGADPHAALGAGMPGAARAPSEAAPSEPTTREEARELVAGMSDEGVRALLLDYLDRALPERREEPPRGGPWLITGSAKAGDQLQRLFQRSHELGDESRRLGAVIGGDLRRPWLSLLAAVLVCLGVGTLLERFMLRPSGVLGALHGVGRPAPDSRPRPGQVLVSALARSVGAVVFLFGAAAALHVIPGLPEGALSLASAAVWLVAGTRVVGVGIRALLLPESGESPWPVSSRVARAVARHLTVVAGLVLLQLVDTDVLATIGARPHFVLTVKLFDGLLLVVAIIVAAFAVNRAMEPVPVSPGPPGIWQVLRARWHLLVSAYTIIVYVLAVYARLVTGEPMLMRALASLSLVLVLPVLDFGLKRLAERLAPAAPAAGPPGDASAELERGDVIAEEQGAPPVVAVRPEDPAPAPPGEVSHPDAMAPAPTAEHPGIRRALLVNFRILLALALATVLAKIWNIRVFDLAAVALGAQFADALLEIGVASLFAFIVWQIVKAALLVHAVPESEGFDLGGDGGAAGQTRVQTLMPLIARTIGVVLVVMLVMIALSAFGVNIGPLLAGAGVVGLAVGFGAQTLVRDIVSGIFFLVDDAFRMGEYLQIGNIRGTVEKISVRSLRLRHHRGPLHTLPYGEIQSMTNYSRDYAIMKFEVRVPFETNVEKVRKLIKQVGAKLAENEEMASVMLEPLKSQGVNRMDDSAFVIRCKFTTIPGKQFTVRRVAYAMIQEAFEKEGIQFAPRRVVVETVAPAGSKEALAAAAAAAEAAIEEQPPRRAADER